MHSCSSRNRHPWFQLDISGMPASVPLPQAIGCSGVLYDFFCLKFDGPQNYHFFLDIQLENQTFRR